MNGWMHVRVLVYMCARRGSVRTLPSGLGRHVSVGVMQRMHLLIVCGSIRNLVFPVLEGESIAVYHSLENGRVYHQDPPQRLEFPLECGPILEYLLECYPEYVRVGHAPGLEEDEEFMDVVVALYDAGLLMKSEP